MSRTVHVELPHANSLAPTTGADALRRAIAAMEAGANEPRSLDGIKAQALESIAWSLIGLLSEQMPAEDQAPRARTVRPAPTSLSGELRSIFGMNEARP